MKRKHIVQKRLKLMTTACCVLFGACLCINTYTVSAKEIPEGYTLLYSSEKQDESSTNSDNYNHYWTDEDEKSPQSPPVTEVPKGYTAIRSVDDLYGINNNPEGNYILMNDIDLSQTAPGGEWDFGNGWKPIEKFSGILDGNGYRIMNMTIYGTSDKDTYYGLIGYTSDGVIKNLGLVNININIDNINTYNGLCIGGIAGYSPSTTIMNCFVTGTITSQSNIEYVGGIVGGGSDIKDSYADVNIVTKSGRHCNGIGDSETERCYTIGNISGNFEFLNMVSGGYTEQCYYLKSNGTDSYATGLSEAQMQKEQCFTGFDFDKVWYIDASSGYNYPQLRNCPQARVSSCELTTPPAKLSYTMDNIKKGNLDLSGGILTLTYEDGIKAPVALENSMISEIYGKSGDNQAPIKVFLKYVNAEISFDATAEKIMATNLKLNKTSYKLDRGKALQIVCNIEPINAENKNLTWTTSNELVATVSNNGIVKALNAGTTEITVSTDNGITASCMITVNVPIKKLNLSASSLTLKKGQKKKVNVVITPLDATDTIAWTSSNPQIAKVNSDGVITAKKQGTAVIMAKTDGGVSKKVKVTVKRK